MKITSPAFAHGGSIPRKYTCDGGNAIPPLAFEDVPKQAKSLVLIMDDPDAPVGTWDHWLVYNIPPDCRGVEEGKDLDAPHGINSWKRKNWGGPCPPDKEHAYVFTLYALDCMLELREPTKKDLLKAMEGYVIAKAELKARYKRPWM